MSHLYHAEMSNRYDIALSPRLHAFVDIAQLAQHIAQELLGEPQLKLRHRVPVEERVVGALQYRLRTPDGDLLLLLLLWTNAARAHAHHGRGPRRPDMGSARPAAPSGGAATRCYARGRPCGGRRR